MAPSPDSALAETIRRIVEIAEPRTIVLFGSAVRGTMGASSDFDLLVVVREGTHRRRTAQRIYQGLVGVGFAADVVVVTEGDVERYRDDPGMVIRPAVREGRVVYAA